MADMPKNSPVLQFNPALPKKDLQKIHDNVSAIVLHGNHLWLGGDEGTSIQTRVLTVPFGVTKDHAEGLSLVSDAPLSAMVCYDSPDATRIHGADGSGVKADIFAITS
jgi:hypothetical protein